MFGHAINETQATVRAHPPMAATTTNLAMGGATTFLLNLARVFGQRGWRLPIVVLTDQFEILEEFGGSNAQVFTLPRRDYIYEDRLAWGYRQLAQVQPRAVLACLSSDSFELLPLVPPGVIRLGIIQSHDPGPYELVPHFVPWLDAMVGVSVEICEHLRSLPCCGSLRIEHIPYGIHFGPLTTRRTRGKEEPLRVVYLGRLAEVQKRISRLARLIRLLDEQKASVKFTIVGTGPDEAEFRRSVAGCSSVAMLGMVPNREVAGLLREQDVHILLSDFEGLPVSLLEAMGEGVVPVISNLPGGLDGLVGPETGFRVPIGDVEAAAKVIRDLAADRERLARLSAAGQVLVRKQFSAERMTERFLALIGEAPDPPAAWPEQVRVPVPKMLTHPWLFGGVPRTIRRGLKRLRAAAR
jgi:glycosyltransferase involved in cell wall biosynthesis